jgi:hypothetical protein
MVRDVVGNAHELVERQNDRAMPAMNEVRRNWKILVVMPFARS